MWSGGISTAVVSSGQRNPYWLYYIAIEARCVFFLFCRLSAAPEQTLVSTQ